MATCKNVELFSGEAGSAVSIYRFVVRAADQQLDHVAVAQSEADGVCAMSESVVGNQFPIASFKDGAVLKVEAGAAVAVNAVIGSDNVGRAITAVSGVGNWRLGKALDAAAGAGEIIRVLAHKELDEVA